MNTKSNAGNNMGKTAERTIQKEIARRVIENKESIGRFLGYGNRPIPKVILRKIDQELETFADYLQIEYGYRLHDDAEEPYADLLYTVGERIEEPIRQYLASSEAMRAMILDKISIVALDAVKDLLLEEIASNSGYYMKKEIYPGSSGFPLAMQREILASVEKTGRIKINEYFQLFPVKSVALRVLLSRRLHCSDRCSTCEAPCEGKISEEESKYLYFLQKARQSTKKLYEERGLSEELFEDNIRDIEVWAEDFRSKSGKRGISPCHFQWIEDILELRIVKLGRLQFEAADSASPFFADAFPYESDTLYLHVHIRAKEDFSPRFCDASYERAASFYRDMGYRFRRICFLCDSWLINPDLQDLLSPESNILHFQSRYTLLSHDDRNRQAEERVFGFLSEDPSSYPENTSLQRNLKSALSRGRIFGTAKGFFFHTPAQDKK